MQKRTPRQANYFVFRGFSYPLWWHLFAAVLPQTTKVTKTITSLSSLQSAQQALQRRRRNVGIDLPYYLRTRTNRDHPSLKRKRCFPISHGITHVSQSHYLETFPSSNGTLGISQTEKTSRPIVPLNDSKTQPSHQGDLRSGFNRSYPLWKTGDGSDGLQSQKVGQTFLSSSPLFQWDHQRFLARRTSSWRYPYRYWHHGTPEGILCQIASLCKGRNNPSRQGFLRSRNQSNIWNPTEPFLSLLPNSQDQSKEDFGASLIRFILSASRRRSLCINPPGGKRNIVLLPSDV